MSEKLVNLTINGEQIEASVSFSIIQAFWNAGHTRVEGIGCLEGVCGSCRVMVRKANKNEVRMQLACQTFVEEGMQVIFMEFPSPTHHSYQLTDIQNSWEVQSKFHQIFPETSNCRKCGGCTESCPKGIDVQHGVELAAEGKFRETGELFIECVMCNLCMTACPEHIAPNHVALFCRRTMAYFHIRPANLISRLEEIRKDELQIVL